MLTWLAHRLDGELAPDEVVDLYPALGWRSGHHWKLRVQGCVHEPGTVPGIARLLRRWLGVDPDGLDPESRERLALRLAPFLVDKERGKRFHLHLGDCERVLGMTGANGHFDGTFRFTESEWAGACMPADRVSTVPIRLRTRRRGRDLRLPVHVVAGGGWSVVADVDDTVKVTQVLDRRETLMNTFVRPFEAVEGVATAFEGWNRRFAPDWHYVSGGPWQLWAALEQFRGEVGLPAGSWHLQQFRAKDRSVLRFLKAPVGHKLAELRALFRMDPGRRFILVGDSGQADPEVYGQVAREFPGRVGWIWIRLVGDPASALPRCERVLGAAPVEGWSLFRTGAELDGWNGPVGASVPSSGAKAIQ